jgi:hypothetical protein
MGAAKRSRQAVVFLRAISRPFAAFALLGLVGCADNSAPRVDSRVSSIALDPPGGTFHAGDTVQFRAAALDANGVELPNVGVEWSTTDTSVAVFGANGRLIAKAAGTTGVTVRAATLEKSTTVSIVYAATIESFADSMGAAVPPSSIAGRVSARVIVRPLGRAANTVALVAACTGRSEFTLASAPATGDVLTLAAATDSLDPATGRALLFNETCRWSARVEFAAGVIRASPSLEVVLRNTSRFSASYSVVSANAPFGAAFPSSVTDGDNREWRAGAVTLRLRARNYEKDQTVAMARGSFLGREFTATAAPGGGDLVVEFPYTSTAQHPLGIADHATTAEGSVPILARAEFGDGSPAFVAVEAQALRLDNAAPAPARFGLAPFNAASGWVNGSYTFGGAGRYDAIGDAIVGSAEVRFYATAAAALGPLAGGTATGAACTTKGLTRVVTGSDVLAALPPATPANSRAAAVRAFEVDRLGNVRCTDLSISPIGVDVLPPRLALHPASSPTRTLFNYKDERATIVVDLVSSDNESGIATPGQVTRRMLGVGPGLGWCEAGTRNECAPTLYPDTLRVPAHISSGGALWRDSAFVHDRAGNVSSPLVSEYIAYYWPPALTTWSEFPAVFVGGTNLRIHLTVTHQLGLMEVGIAADYSYAPADMTINFPAYLAPERWVTYPTMWQTKFAGYVTIPRFMRQLQMVDANDRPYDDSGAYTKAYALLSYAEAVSGDRTGDFYGLGDKNMPLGHTYFGKGIQSFRLTTPETRLSNSASATVTLRAELVTDLNAAGPFQAVCFYYRRLVAEHTTYGRYEWYPAGCRGDASTSTTATGRRYVFDLTWDPPEVLGTSAAPHIRAIGVNATGDGLTTRSSTSVQLVP